MERLFVGGGESAGFHLVCVLRREIARLMRLRASRVVSCVVWDTVTDKDARKVVLR
jgi:hypothetical protein